MNGKFIKFNEISNHYQTKELNEWIETYPELMSVECIVENKIDGSNAQFIFSPNSEIKVGSRNRLLTSDMFKSLNGIETAFTKYKKEFSKIQGFSDVYDVNINIYCEFFGKGVQNRINYGEDKYLNFISARINENVLTPEIFYKFLDDLSISHMKCHNFGKMSLKKALDFNVEILEPLNPIENNYIEGVVIKPFYKNYYNKFGALFILKKKSPKFEEKMKIKKVKKIKTLDESEKRLIDLHEDFLTYININRMHSAFSKEMRSIKDSSEITYFLKIILNDAKNDWKKDHINENLNAAQEKIVFNGGKKISKLLIEYMKGSI